MPSTTNYAILTAGFLFAFGGVAGTIYSVGDLVFVVASGLVTLVGICTVLIGIQRVRAASKQTEAADPEDAVDKTGW